MKKLSGLLVDFLLLAVIDGLLIYTELVSASNPFRGDIKKVFLIAFGNLLCVLIMLWGEKISGWLHRFKAAKVIDIALLLFTVPVMVVFVQMITWIAGYRNKAVSYLGSLLKKVFTITTPDLIGNLVIGYLIYLFLIVLFRKVKTASAALCYLFLIVALVNYFVTEFRGEAFFLLDIVGAGTAADVVGEYEFKLPMMMGIPLIYTVVLAQISLKFQTLELGKKSRKNLLCRMGAVAAVVIAVALWAKPVIMKMDNVSLWNVGREYKKRGLVYTMTREVRYIFVEEPSGYSVEKVKELAEEIQKEGETTAEKIVSAESTSKKDTTKDTASGENMPKDATSEKTAAQEATVTPQNIIMIMNESLADFESVGEIKSNVEIMPYIRNLDENVKHGHLHMPTYGGGTARSEYEALTGNSISFLPAGSVPYQLYVRDPEYGMADILKSLGYYTIAMHPNKASNWNRSNVYQQMGFDEFLSSENWGDTPEKIRNYASDKAAYDKIISLVENKEEGEKLFTFCVTMQNHGGYTDSSLGDFEKTVKLDYDTTYPLAETFLSLERESDTAFKDLLEYFQNVEEPTMIIMFGDHWPKIEEGFLAQILGKNRQDLDLVESQVTYTTPYVIWTNYPSETVEEDFSSNYLGSYILKLAGLEMPEYNQFLLSLKEELPIIGVGAVCDKDGNWYEDGKLPEEYQSLLNDYNILEYNNQFEKKEVVESLFTLGN